MTNLEILRAARLFLSEPQNWFQGRAFPPSAYKNEGFDRPCSMCAWMALRWFAAGEKWAEMPESAQPLMKLLNSLAPGGNIIKFNDDPTTTHEAVLAVFDAAITSLENQNDPT